MHFFCNPACKDTTFFLKIGILWRLFLFILSSFFFFFSSFSHFLMTFDIVFILSFLISIVYIVINIRLNDIKTT